MKKICFIFVIVILLSTTFVLDASCEEQNKVDIDLDLNTSYKSNSVKDKLQGRFEAVDKNRNLRPLSSDEWLKFHNKKDFRNHKVGNVGNRAMADEIKNSHRYRGSNLDPLKDPTSEGFDGKIDLN